MILYLSRNESVNLLDKAANEKSLHVRKMSGNFPFLSLLSGICGNSQAAATSVWNGYQVTEKDNEFLEALQSYSLFRDAQHEDHRHT